MKNFVSALTTVFQKPVGSLFTNSTTTRQITKVKPVPMVPLSRMQNETPKNLQTPHLAQKKVDTKAIQDRAYQLWLQNGCHHGEDQKYWYQAERELTLSK